MQLNELVRQVFNFSGTAASANNPYLFTYSANLARGGWGLRAGPGCSYQNFKDDDGIIANETDANAFNGRLGAEKAFVLSPKWSTGIGVDAIYGRNNSKTITAAKSLDSRTTSVVSNISSLGGGPIARLRYQLTPSVLIGTETGFYYSSGKEEQEVRITHLDFTGGPGSGQFVTNSSTINDKRAQGTFSIPAVFCLMVRF